MTATGKNQGKRLCFLFLLLIVTVGVLTGCGGEGPHNTEDVREYIKNELGIEQFDILQEQQEDYHIWTIRLKDGSGQKFHVVDEISYGLFSSSRYLTDDYEAAAALYESRNLLEELELEARSDTLSDGLLEVDFIGTFTDRASLDLALDHVNTLAVCLQNSEHPCRISYELQFAHLLREVPAASDLEDNGDFRDWRVTEVDEEARRSAHTKLLLFAAAMDYTDVLEAYSEEELLAAIAGSDACIGVCHGDPERDSYDYYDDICGTPYGSRISYPMFYRLLVKEGFDVEGDERDYTFTGVDGHTYRVIYHPEAPDVRYLQDGYEVPMTQNNQYAHFYALKIQEIAGINVYIWKMNSQPNSGVYTDSGHLSTVDMIRLDGAEMTYTTQREGYFNNTTDHYRYVYYDENTKCYMIPIDIGLHTDNMSYPVIWKEWVCALGGTYEYKDLTFFEKVFLRRKAGYRSVWEIDGVTCSMRSEYSNNDLTKLEFKKNKQTVDIRYQKRGDDGYQVGSSFMAAISVEDFAKLLGLTYEIDEAEGSIDFYTTGGR